MIIFVVFNDDKTSLKVMLICSREDNEERALRFIIHNASYRIAINSLILLILIGACISGT